MPALLTVASQQGAGAAADAAAGGIVGCALACLFAAAYHRAAQRLAPIPTVLCGLAALVVGLGIAHAVRMSLAEACGLALATGTAAWVSMRRPLEPSRTFAGKGQPGTTRQSIAWAVAVGTVSASVAALVVALNPVLAGIVAAMPMVGVAVVATQHVQRGPDAVAPQLRGYVLGSMSKAVFCAVFAACAAQQGVAFAILAALVLSVGPLAFWVLNASADEASTLVALAACSRS